MWYYLITAKNDIESIVVIYFVKKGVLIMENKMFTITEEEQKAVAKRTAEISAAVKDAGIREALVAYATANGYSEEEAINLVDKIVIPTVDDYNTSCREVFEGDVKTWVAQKMTASIEKRGLNEQEAAKYKLGVLQAIRKLNAGAVGGEEEILTEDEKAMLDAAEITPEMMLQIDEALIASIEDSAMPLYMTEAFETFLDSKVDDESIRVVTNELWEDNNLKYCAATAMCIAHHNGEIPSIPEETADENLVLGACQGVDVINIETKISTGEMAADTAYKVLKVIGAVVLTLAVGVILLETLDFLFDLSCTVAFVVFGTGILGVIIAGVLMGYSVSTILDMATEWVEHGISVAGKIADTTYRALKSGTKMVYHYTLERIIPVINNAVVKAKETICGIVAKLVQMVRSKAASLAKA